MYVKHISSQKNNSSDISTYKKKDIYVLFVSNIVDQHSCVIM